jgi:hypothetical protein
MTQKIRIPESLRKMGSGSGNNGGDRREKTMSHKDISNILTLQKNPELLMRYRREKERQRREEAYYRRTIEEGEDFMTACLIQWSPGSLVKVTALLLEVASQVDANNYEEALFSDHTLIHITDEDTPCFADYYRMVYHSAVQKIATDEQRATPEVMMDEDEEYRQTHITKLMRACFLIGFLYDARIRRFVMAHHSLHTHYMMTRPPPVDKIRRFMAEAGPVVDDFLFGHRLTILEMIDQCVGIWLARYMI